MDLTEVSYEVVEINHFLFPFPVSLLAVNISDHVLPSDSKISMFFLLHTLYTLRK